MTLHHILQCVRAALNDNSKWRPQGSLECPSAAEVVRTLDARWKPRRAIARASPCLLALFAWPSGQSLMTLRRLLQFVWAVLNANSKWRPEGPKERRSVAPEAAKSPKSDPRSV